jgi:hypothetical protein
MTDLKTLIENLKTDYPDLHNTLSKSLDLVSNDTEQFETKLNEIISEYETLQRVKDRIDYLKVLQ